MNTFFIADTHFNHTNIIKHTGRPFQSVEHMNEVLIERWNQVVRPKDLVYHLGDFGWGNVVPVLKRLHGKKILIIGNHDKPSLRPAVRPFFERQEKLLNIKIDKQHIVLCHYAMRVWDGSHHGAWHLYGHSHGTLPSVGKSMDVGVDVVGSCWEPFSFEEIKTRMALHSENINVVHDDPPPAEKSFLCKNCGGISWSEWIAPCGGKKVRHCRDCGKAE